MFNMRQNSQNNQLNVNTKLYSSFSDTCMITMGAWNLQLSLKFHPVKGTNPNTGLRQYATDNNEIINTSLSVANATALLKGIKDVIEPAIANKEVASFGIPISSGDNAKTLTISYDKSDISIAIAINLDADGKTTAENILSHKFPKKVYFEGYNPISGGGNQITVESDFEDFKKKLESIYDLAPATAHSIKYNNALVASFRNQNASNSQTNSMNNYQAPTTTGGSLDDVFNGI